MKVLVACEESQAVTKELRALGHEAYSCDIIECSGGHPEWHIMQDVIPLLNGNCTFRVQDSTEGKKTIWDQWDMIIAFPPCTYLTVTGNRWFNVERYGEKAIERQKLREEAIEFFMAFANANCKKIAIENPVGIMSSTWRKPDQIINPFQFGDPFEKKTCLWLKGLPELMPTDIVEVPPRKQFESGKSMPSWYAELWNLPKEERAKMRSKTFPGIAKAMAEQWAGENRKEKEEMELRIEKITFPEVIEFNFNELKQEITNRVAMYANMVYTEDQVKQAKADRANLNKFVKALSDERIKVKKQCLKPYEEFEAKVNELSKIVQEPINLIDKQVKEYEEQKKRDKLDEITNFFNSTDHPEWLHISKIMNEKWLNASVSMKSIQAEIDSRLEQIKNDIATLSNLPEFGFEATEAYKTTLDINKALNEGHRLSEIQNRKAEHEAEQARLKAEAELKKAEPQPQPTQEGFMHPPVEEAPAKQWVSFAALLSVEDGKALKAFFESRKIEFKAV